MGKNTYHNSAANLQNHGRFQSSFENLEATELYCPKCKRATPVNLFLLLVLPDGDRYEYRCRFCGSKVGAKIDHTGQFHDILKN